MAEQKSIDRAYLLSTLRHFAGKELYDDITDVVIKTSASAEKPVNFEKSAVQTTYYVYTGENEYDVLVTADNIDTYTALGLTVVVGDTLRKTIEVTADNIDKFSVLIPGIEIGNYINPVNPDTAIPDTRLVSDDSTSEVNVDFLNATFFPSDDPVEVGEAIVYTPDEIEETTTFKSLIKDLYEKKVTVETTTVTAYRDKETAGEIEDNTIYVVTNAAEPTAWLRGQNLFGGGGGIETTGAKDGDFLVFNKSLNKPVWKTIQDAMTIGW